MENSIVMDYSFIRFKIRAFKQRFLYLISRLIGPFLPIKHNLIFMWSYSGKNFSCNPAYFTRYLMNNHPGEYELVWLFDNAVALPDDLHGIKTVKYASWQHLLTINKAEVIITNARVENRWALWKKKRGQKYIMTYHASMGVKKVELDANQQYASYIQMAKEDSDRCDLMLSGSGFWSSVMRRSFQYQGEILEAGTPRNDFLFHPELWNTVRDRLNDRYSIPKNAKLILYAPTFRNDGGLNHYQIDWPRVLNSLETRFGGEFCVLFRLHPNMLKKNKTANPLVSDSFLSRDLTQYYDMQELLAVSDVLVTDYSSSMFDFALKEQPVFIYADDILTYNRGTYIELDKLPFPFSTTSEELAQSIDSFNETIYKSSLNEMMTNIVCTYESGKASLELYHWIKKHTSSVLN